MTGPPARSAAPAGGSSSRAFVGRERELGELSSGLAGALEGRGALYAVSGEPGIGKTRLAVEFAAAAATRGAAVLWGRCWEGGGAPAFWPWVQVIREYARSCDSAALTDQLGAGAAYVVRLVPELRERLPHLPPPAALDSENARFYLFDATSTFLRNASLSRPLVCLFDDLHWADVPSLLLLKFVAHALADSRLFAVATYREIDPRQPAEVRERLLDLHRDARAVALGGLTEDQTARFIESALGAPPRAEVVSALHRSTEGNPLFLDELVRLLERDGKLADPARLEPGALKIPGGVLQTIRGRLSILGPETRETLTVAAVIGREFDLPSLQHVCGIELVALARALDEAAAAGLVSRPTAAPLRYCLSHALVREALLEDLGAARRVELHARAGAALEELYRDNLAPHFAELAHHFGQAAATAAGAERAVFYARLAGERAASLLAYEEAALHFRGALAAMAPGAGETERCELLLALGDAEWRAGDTPAAKTTFLRAAEIATALGDAGRLARAALGHGTGLGGLGFVNRADPVLIDLLERALGALGGGDGVLRVRCLSRLAVELYFTRAVERRAALSLEAMEMAARLGDPAIELVAAYSRELATLGPDEVGERIAAARRIRDLAERLGDREMAFRAHCLHLAASLEIGDLRSVDAAIEACDVIAGALRQPLYAWHVAIFRTMRALFDGRFDEADRLSLHALELGQRVQSEMAMEGYGAQTFALHWARGRLAELAAPTEAFAEQYPWVPGWRAALAFLYSEIGEEAKARAEIELLASDSFAKIPRDGVWILTLSFLALACARLRDGVHGASLYEALLPYAGRCAISAAGSACVGPVANPLGALAVMLGRGEEARRHFEAALALESETGNRPYLAWTLTHFAALLLEGGGDAERARAFSMLEQAGALAEALGMPRIAASVAEVRTPPSEPSEGEPRSNGNAFVREGEVWLLVFEGRSVRLRHSKGLAYLQELLRRPGEEVHVADLAGAASAEAGPEVSAGLTMKGGLGDAGPVLDSRARGEYRRRVDELSAELDEAVRWNDAGRAERLREEIGFLTSEIAGATGLGGRSRKAGDVSERLRKAVASRLGESIARIRSLHPSLGAHLEASVLTGFFCRYAPGKSVAWRLS